MSRLDTGAVEGTVYLAARYSRRVELCGYRRELQAAGWTVTSRWLDGDHRLNDDGRPTRDDGADLRVLDRSLSDVEAVRLRDRFALDDYEDVCAAATLVAFTEPPRSTSSRGGRHVEFGLALGLRKRVVVVGGRENLFYWLPAVEHYPSWPDALIGLARPSHPSRLSQQVGSVAEAIA